MSSSPTNYRGRERGTVSLTKRGSSSNRGRTRIDTSTELGRRVYELVKAGSLSWSIGYVVSRGGSRRNGKLTELTEIDLAEVSAVPVPANEGARTLSIKSHRPVELVSFEVA